MKLLQSASHIVSHSPVSHIILSLLLLLSSVADALSIGDVKDVARGWWDSKVPAGLRREGYTTEPRVLPQILEYKYMGNNTKETLSPGYIFLAMMERLGGDIGPQIYDTDGQLVWFGNYYTRFRVTDFKVCDYMGTNLTHLCWSERELNHEARKPIIHKVFVDDSYNMVANHSTRGDGHEFRAVDNGYAFLTMDYKRVIHDLRRFHGVKDGWINDACIVEYDSKTAKVNWEWCYSKRGLDLGESNVFFKTPGQTKAVTAKAGAGRYRNPWDFAHLNAIDKNDEGDYLASLRHLDAIYKIAGPKSASGRQPGTVLWRLGGKSSDFEMDFNFSKQHDVRYISTGKNETVLSLFDNAWEGVNKPTALASSGKVIRINNSTKKAHLLHEYVHPRGRLAGSRGSIQITESENAFVGWGILPEMSEYAPNGEALYHARFALPTSTQYSYRAFKFPWVGKPSWEPKLVAYTYDCLEEEKPLYAYVSWNGATEVTQYRFLKAYQEHGPWLSGGTFDKTGFETRANLGSAAPYVYVEALDANGDILATVQRQTFVPHLGIKRKCDEFRCEDHFDYNDAASRGQTCERFYAPAVIPFVVALIFFELATYWARVATCWSIDKRKRGRSNTGITLLNGYSYLVPAQGLSNEKDFGAERLASPSAFRDSKRHTS